MLRSAAECWAITDTAAGNQRQALALAERLGLPLRQLVLEPRAPWSWFAPRLFPGGSFAIDSVQRSQFSPPWPHIAISCGRAAALFTRQLRGLSKGHCHTVQILDPRINPAHWDTVIAPLHDQLSGPNVLTPVGSLNPVDETWLDHGRCSQPLLAELPQPRIGVLLGGPRKGLSLNSLYARQLAARLLTRQREEGGSLLVLGSRRTPPELSAIFQQELRATPGLRWFNQADGPNPYQAVLGWADRLVVTPDSVNMLSEACAVGCPVQTLVTAPLPPKLQRFHQALRHAGQLHDIDAPATAERVAPLRETAALARALRARVPARPPD